MANKLRNIVAAGMVGLASLLPAKASAQNVSGDLNLSTTNSYLANGFSFNDDPTIFLDGNLSFTKGNSTLKLTGIHSRNVKNHFNGKTSWIEWTGMADYSHSSDKGTASLGAYFTLLPESVFDIKDVDAIYASFSTSTNPSVGVYLEKGFDNLNGWIGKTTITESTNVKGIPLSMKAQFSAMAHYFIDKEGPQYASLELSAPVYSKGPLSVNTSMKYQQGIGPETVTGLEGKVSASWNFR